jgi:hypothetical protein
VATDLQPGGHDPNGTERRPRLRRAAAIAALLLGLFGFVVCAVGLAIAVLPRHFTTGEQQRIMAWEVSGRWRDMPAGQIFPGSVVYSLPATAIEDSPPLSLRAVRVAIAPQSACAAAMTDSAAAAVLRRRGCEAVLRATYIDETSSFVVTVGVAVLPTPSAATAASAGISGTELAASRQAGQLPAGVRTVHFTGAVAGLFDYNRQISATMPAGPYLVMYAAGYSDGRPRVQLAHDSYSEAEMASMAEGVADSVADGLGATPSVPHCPGDPGC